MIDVMSNIAIIYTGGTFGCVGEPLAPMPAAQFIQKIQNNIHAEHVTLDFYAAPAIKDSSELTIGDWLQHVKLIQDLRTKHQHFILIHGTDTLNYASALFNLMFTDQIHLIVTGSQRPLLNVEGTDLRSDSDALVNLTFAIQQIQQVKAGVYAAFNQQIFEGSSCYKLHTQHDQAFLGQPVSGESHLALERFNHATFADFKPTQTQIDLADNLRILNLYLSPSQPSHLVQSLESIARDAPHILILQGFGSGNIAHSAQLIQQIQCLLAQGCWVVISSQVLFGGLSQQYATGSWLKDVDVVFDPHLSQADLYARAALLYLRHHQEKHWQQYWY